MDHSTMVTSIILPIKTLITGSTLLQNDGKMISVCQIRYKPNIFRKIAQNVLIVIAVVLR